MALIICPDCRREISTAAAACPHCGRVVNKPAEGFGHGLLRFGCWALVILIGTSLLILFILIVFVGVGVSVQNVNG